MKTIIAFLVLIVLGFTQGFAQEVSGKGELISRFDADGRQRYEANLFGGKVKQDEKSVADFQGGFGYGDYRDSDDLQYLGAVSRIVNDTTLILNYSNDLRQDSDLQGRTKIFENTFLGGGINSVRSSDKDTWFLSAWQVFDLSETIDQDEKLWLRGGFIDFEDHDSGEGTFEWQAKHGSVGFNINREEFRASAGFIQEGDLSGEVTYVDGDIDQSGPRALLSNFTLVKDHPFLSNLARQGRIGGRSGVSSANPILAGSNFFNPYTYNNFNRLQFTQDIGDGIVGRFRYFEFPNTNSNGFLDMLVFPGYFAELPTEDILRHMYLGFAYDYSSQQPSSNSDAFGFEAGLKAVNLVGKLNGNVHFRGVGIFQSGEEDAFDVIAYVSYLFA